MTHRGTIQTMRPRHWRVVETVLAGATMREAAELHQVSLATVAAIMRGAGYRAKITRTVTWEKTDA